MFSPLTKQLIDALSRLPGVGPKSAQRLAFHLLTKEGRNKGLGLSEAISHAVMKVANCQKCQTYTEADICSICSSNKRNRKQLCFVEGPLDLLAIEHTNSYSGLYFVLHGRLSPLDGIGPTQLGISSALKVIEENGVEEVILATNPTVEGKATAYYIASQLPPEVSCTQIAQGIPLGGELEYLDGGTLSLALSARRQLKLANEVI
jgi:recombination protein RecR